MKARLVGMTIILLAETEDEERELYLFSLATPYRTSAYFTQGSYRRFQTLELHFPSVSAEELKNLPKMKSGVTEEKHRRGSEQT